MTPGFTLNACYIPKDDYLFSLDDTNTKKLLKTLKKHIKNPLIPQKPGKNIKNFKKNFENSQKP
jgi:hypothetical protein